MDHETGKTNVHPDGSTVFRTGHVVNFCGHVTVETFMVVEDTGPVLGQLPTPDSNYIGMNLVFTRKPVDLLNAFKYFQRKMFD